MGSSGIHGGIYTVSVLFLFLQAKMSTFVRSYWWHTGRLYMTCSSLCLKFFVLAFTLEKRKINLNREFLGEALLSLFSLHCQV